MSDFDDQMNGLIPELREWSAHNGRRIGAEDWIAGTGNFRKAVGYSAVFWPRFVEFAGYVLREGFSLESLRGYEANMPRWPRRTIEATMNHLHIADIQSLGCEDRNRERVLYLGRTLREIYAAKLAWQFPEKRFEVRFNDDFFATTCWITN